MDFSICERVARVLDLCTPLDALSALVATHEIIAGISGATPFELMVVALAESEARRRQADGRAANLDAAIESTRRRMRASPPWNAPLWDISFDAAFREIADQWRAWRENRKEES